MEELKSKIAAKSPIIKTENLLKKLKLLTLWLNQETESSKDLEIITETQIQTCNQLYSISGEVRKNITRYKSDIDKAKLADRTSWEKCESSREDYEENFTNLLMQTSMSDYFSSKKFSVTKIRQNPSIKKKESKYYEDSKNFTLAHKTYLHLLETGSPAHPNPKHPHPTPTPQLYLSAYDDFIDQGLTSYLSLTNLNLKTKTASQKQSILSLATLSAAQDTSLYFLKFKPETLKTDYSMGPIDPY
jgi:hypothetical protein